MSPPGRLSEPRKREIYEAVLEFLREVGYQGLSMPALAARARCSTATIYRQWQGKAGLVIAALTNRQPELAADVDTGSLAGDLYALVRRLPDVASGEIELMAALAHAAMREEDVAKAMRDARRATRVGSPSLTIVISANPSVARRPAEGTPRSPDVPAAAPVPWQAAPGLRRGAFRGSGR